MESKTVKGEIEIITIPKEVEPISRRLDRIDRILTVKKHEVTDVEQIGPELPDGSINYDCNCVGSLPFGPCGKLYRKTMECMKNYEYARSR